MMDQPTQYSTSGPWQDAIDPRYAEIGPYQSLEQAIAYGVTPVDGMIFRGNQMPGTGVDHSTGKMYEPGFIKGGRMEYIGQQDTGNRNPEHGPSSVGQYRFVAEEEKAPEPVRAMPMQDDPAPSGPTIYDSTEDWIRIARAEDQGRNRMPFVGPNWSDGNKTYGDIPYNPLLSLEMFYPGDKNDFQKKNKSPYEGGLLSNQLGGMMMG